MVQSEVEIMWAVLEPNVILIWFLVFLRLMLLKHGLLVWFMNLEEKKCIVVVLMAFGSFGFHYVVNGLIWLFC